MGGTGGDSTQQFPHPRKLQLGQAEGPVGTPFQVKLGGGRKAAG